MGATWRLIEGDSRDALADLPAQSVQTCVTSPPYFGLRDYGTGEWEGGALACDHLPGNARRGVEARSSTLGGGKAHITAQEGGAYARQHCKRCGATRIDSQIGLEPTPDEFVAALVAVFREVRRVLRDDGTVWLNLGDSYAGGWGRQAESRDKEPGSGRALGAGPRIASGAGSIPEGANYKAKDLLGVPWQVAFALRADGWYLRSDIIWSKPNPMPESVTDRPTKAHEYLFLLSKRPTYFYDADAIRESWADDREGDPGFVTLHARHADRQDGGVTSKPQVTGRNKRSVWRVATQPYAGAHFATFPPKLIEPCILAGCPEGGTVLDPFAGSGTTGLVALRPYGMDYKPLRGANGSKRWVDGVEGDALAFDPTPLLRFPKLVLFGANWYADRLPASGGWLVWDVRKFSLQWGGEARNAEPHLHPTQKPVGLMRWIVEMFTSPGDLVLDPYMGSGPVAQACKETGRGYLGFEIDQRYIDAALSRLAQGTIFDAA